MVNHHDEYRAVIRAQFASTVAGKISEIMALNGISKSKLAERMGKSRAHITQLLSGRCNITVYTLAELALALGYELKLDAIPLRES